MRSWRSNTSLHLTLIPLHFIRANDLGRQANQLIGAAVLELDDKVVVVSLRRISNAGEESFDTFFGRVVSYSKNTIIVARKNGVRMSLPYDEDVYRKAEPGPYV